MFLQGRVTILTARLLANFPMYGLYNGKFHGFQLESLGATCVIEAHCTRSKNQEHAMQQNILLFVILQRAYTV